MARQGQGRPLLFYMVALVCALTLPPLTLSLLSARQWVVAEQARLETAAQEANNDVLAKIEQYFAGQVAMLQALATSPALEAGDFERFDRQARDLLGLQGVNIVLRDLTGQQRVNTRLPWGRPLPRVDLSADRIVAQTKQPYISDLFIGAVSPEPMVIVDVPVLRQGEAAYFLNASLPASAIGELLRQSGIEAPFYASLADRNGAIIARSDRDGGFVGKPLPGFAAAQGDRGTWSGVNPQGIDVVASYRRSPLSGWLVTVGVDKEALAAPLHQSQWMLGGLAAFLILVAIGASLAVARKLLCAHESLLAAARAVGDGAVIAPPRTFLRETDLVGDTLAAASVRLGEQAQALGRANRELETRVEERTWQLSQQTELLEATLDNMDQGLVVIDADRRLTVVSRRAAELLELPVAMLGGPLSYEDLVASETACGGTGLDPFPASGPLCRRLQVFERTRPNGTILEIRTVPLEDGGTVCIYSDVTDRRRAEASIRDSEARYRALAESTSDMIVRNSLQGVREYVSPASRSLLGHAPEELVGNRPTEIMHPDDVEPVLRQVAPVAAGEAERDTAVYRLRHKDGHWVWVEANFQLTRGADGRPAGIISAVRDVSERRRQAEELRAAKEMMETLLAEAQRASQSKTDFLASMSHEIRTPLNSIIGFTSLLLEGSRHTPEDRRLLELIQGSGSALLTIVNDILDFSKIEAGQIELDPVSFSVRGLIDNTVSIIRGVAGQRLEIRSDLDAGLPAFVIADESRLRQVLLNLMNNAVKFTAGGHVEIRVRKEAEDGAGACLFFAVSDTGIGIPKDRLERLFERFTQVDGSISRRFGGTGLGLSISRHLVELMGGEIGVESVEGRGSTFWFRIRVPVAAEAGESAAAAVGIVLKDGRAVRPARILLVEDLDINQELARAVLERAGHAVDVASDGAEALQAVQRRPYDVVLMDVQMPVMDGIEATERIRNLEGPVRTLPIIAMTANVLPEQVTHFKRAGMNDHVGKPFKKEELLAVIESWMPEAAGEEACGEQESGAPASRASGEPHGRRVLDRSVFESLVRLLGPERTAGLLVKLERLLTDRFLEPPAEEAAPDRSRLAVHAHAAVSTAGMLGFGKLSELCRSLEASCLEGGPIDGLLDQVRGACLDALGEIRASHGRLAAASTPSPEPGDEERDRHHRA